MLLRTDQRARVAPRVVREVRPGHLVALAAGLVALVRLPFLTTPLSPDEGGFFMVAAQWRPGSSLYGDYFVDRPPLLMGLFALADAAGGTVPLRLLGVLAVVVSVLLASRIGAVVAPARPWARVLPAVAVATLASTPLHGAQDVNGELLALPLVLAGLLAVLIGLDRGPGRVAAWAAAGVLATCAMAVKQSVVDVFVAGLVAAACLARTRPREALRLLGVAAAASLVTLGLLLAWAASRGTGPVELWQATVQFRLDAGQVISASATGATGGRAAGLALSFVASGASVIIAVCLLPSRRAALRRPPTALVVAIAVLLAELAVVAGGGSYWRHYLVGTIPGLVLLLAVTLEHRPHRTRALAVTVAAAIVSAVVALVAPVAALGTTDDGERLTAFLRAQAHPGDTAVTGFGDPAILRESGLDSPYEQLWSLPVRVLDPDLAELTRVLEQERPTWVVVSGRTLETWGVDAGAAQAVLEHHYRVVAVFGDRWVYLTADRAGR